MDILDLLLIPVLVGLAAWILLRVIPRWYASRLPPEARGLEPWGAGVGPAPGQKGPVIPRDELPPVLTRTYEGTANTVRQLREADAEALSFRHYYPAASEWIPQRRGWLEWIAAFVLILVLVGFVIIVYFLANPTGLLIVTYERLLATDRSPEGRSGLAVTGVASGSPMKRCPDCAESVLESARICRYCRHEFRAAADSPPVPPPYAPPPTWPQQGQPPRRVSPPGQGPWAPPPPRPPDRYRK